MSEDCEAQQTRVGEIRGFIEDIHSHSIDIRHKACELTPSAVPEKKAEVEDKALTAPTVADEFIDALRAIRSILREAYATLTAFN